MPDYEYCRNDAAPFYVRGVFMRLGCGECDFCMFSSEEYSEEEGGVCPSNLWWTVMQRQKVMQKFDASHPPVCPNCGKLTVSDRTVTRGDKDVAAFSCNSCHKINRDSRASINERLFFEAKKTNTEEDR
jgi:hypothetical protein